MSDASTDHRPGHVRRIIVSVVACVLLGGAAVGASWLIFASEPTAQQEGATRRSAALVETTTVSRGTYRPQLSVLGLVEPARDVELSPRVSGQVIDLEPSLEPGGFVAAGEPLLQIDPADFERLVTARESDVRQVAAELAIEQGRQRVARREFELLGEDVNEENRALVLREPQIESIRARLLAAEAELEQARLDLERTTVRAPFDAQVLSRAVNIGSQVSAGDPLARLVGTEACWVTASVPLRDLRWIRFPDAAGDDGDDPGTDPEATAANVTVRHDSAWAPGLTRTGRVSRLIGAVDASTRLARVLVTVPDPLGRETGGPPLILGTIVRLQIEGRPLEDVVRLDRDLLRQDDTVWVMRDEKLEIRRADVVFSDAQYAYLRSGVEAGEQVVLTNLATVTEGLPLRTAAEEPAVARADAPDEQNADADTDAGESGA
jgi:RND family efflux transporter MFP subunit